jgi:hypothetical protein
VANAFGEERESVRECWFPLRETQKKLERSDWMQTTHEIETAQLPGGRFPITLYKEQWLKLRDMFGRHSRVHCCERSATKGELTESNSDGISWEHARTSRS